MKKVYLITGASSDIGMAFIRYIAVRDENAVFFAHYRTENETFMQLKNDFSNTFNPIKADLSDEAGIFEIISAVKETKAIPAHILHLPASRIEYRRLKQLSKCDINREINIEVYSLFEILKEFLPTMAKNKYGKIAVMLTTYTRNKPPKFLTDYVVSKYALMGLIKSIAAEYDGKGVYINGISPNMVETKFLLSIDERITEMVAKNNPLGRHLTVGEVVSALNFVLSDEINCMSGENIFL